MIVNFKNNQVINISKEIARILYDRITKGCNNWQCFEDEKGNIILMINLAEINYIK